jgi:hypothetical protein
VVGDHAEAHALVVPVQLVDIRQVQLQPLGVKAIRLLLGLEGAGGLPFSLSLSPGLFSPTLSSDFSVTALLLLVNNNLFDRRGALRLIFFFFFKKI